MKDMPVIFSEEQKKQQCHYLQIQVCLLKRLNADLFRYMCEFYDDSFLKSEVRAETAIKY